MMPGYAERSAVALFLWTTVSMLGCADGDNSTLAPNPGLTQVEEVSVALLHTPESKEFAQQASNAFNTVRNTLVDGAVVKLYPTSVTTDGMPGLLDQQPSQSFLWLAQSSLQVEGARAQLESNGIGRGSCESLFFTAPAFAYRSVDSFAFGAEGQPLDLSLFLERPHDSSIPEPALVTGHPLLSPSGGVALSMLASAASGVSYADMTADTLVPYRDKLKRLGGRIIHQFGDDQAMLEWLASREGGIPILAITTRQQLRSFSKRSPRAQLSEAIASVSPFDLDYPLCVFESAQSSARQQQAARIARGFLASSHVSPFIEATGFSDKRPRRPSAEQLSQPSLASLVDSRDTLREGSWNYLVFDTSLAVERSLLDSIRKLLAEQLRKTTPLTSLTSIMSCSTTPEVLSRATKSSAAALHAVEKLRVSGGFAFGDCVLGALESASEPEVRDLRKTILVLTRGRETSNVAALTALKQIVPQRLNRTQTVVYVVSIEHKPGENAAFDAHARALGALVVQTTPSTLSDTVSGILSEFS